MGVLLYPNVVIHVFTAVRGLYYSILPSSFIVIASFDGKYVNNALARKKGS